MNDDITTRELELVNAILTALKENGEISLITTSESESGQNFAFFQDGLNAGYQDAVDTVIGVLNDRGFEIKIIKENHHDCEWDESPSVS